MSYRHFMMAAILLSSTIANGQLSAPVYQPPAQVSQPNSALNNGIPNNIGVSYSVMDKMYINIARYQINDIKTKGIIVRLKTNKDRIDAYRKEGYKKVADKLEDRSKARNLMLMYAFLTEWSYCPVYFMESQNTKMLLQHDTLIAKTYDLLRDTAIYMHHDSFYILDFGTIMAATSNDGPKAGKIEQSSTPAGDDYLVIKDHNQNQLHEPMPFEAKVWFAGLSNTDKIEPVNIPAGLQDSIARIINKDSSMIALNSSANRNTTNRFLNLIYDHITTEYKKTAYVDERFNKKLDEGSAPSTTSYSYNGTAVMTTTISSEGGPGASKGNPFQKSVKRLNERIIDYFCKRLDKDKNITGNDDPIYWWHRNPNIAYLPYLRDLELRLKKSLDSKEKFISSH
jgi:hypothetical protein